VGNFILAGNIELADFTRDDAKTFMYAILEATIEQQL
jgi:hypothetical protein